MKLAMFGLGYVGCVSAACLAHHGHKVVGVDINLLKVRMVNAGQSPILEERTAELVQEAVASKKLWATNDAVQAVESSEAALVCVGTPSRRNGSLNLQYVEHVVEQIGSALRKHKDFYTVIIRSTMLPGSTENVVMPILKESSGKRIGESIGLCVNPEFLREGSAVHDFEHPPFTLIGIMDEWTATEVENIYKGINAPLIRHQMRVIEMVKYISNAYHALKVVFANEIGNLCKCEGIDSHVLMEIFMRDRKLNISEAYLRPGYAFGGSCLPKDLRALLYRAKEWDLKLPLLEAVLPSNELQIRRVLDMVIDTGERRVSVLGLSFKTGTDDLRESPMVELVELLIGKGFDLRIYDRNVLLSRLVGSNRQYIEEKLPHIESIIVDSLDKALSHGKVLIVGSQDRKFKSLLRRVSKSKVVIDLARVIDDSGKTKAKYRGICW